MNLSIPDAAVELGVSETRLRKTLTEIVVPTLIEFRRTRTGIRKTTVLGAEAIGRLRAHFEAPLPPAAIALSGRSGQAGGDEASVGGALAAANMGYDMVSAAGREPGSAYGAGIVAEAAGEEEVYSAAELRFLGVERAAIVAEAPTAYSCEASVPSSRQDQEASEETASSTPADRQEAAEPLSSCGSGQTVPLAQFNALLYQHNVLRQELARVSDYLEGCDRLLGEMVRTISTLEERTMKLERSPGSVARRLPGISNPLSGALRTVSVGVQNALFARSTPKPAEVYYANVLTGR